jgi:hypothetical protein
MSICWRFAESNVGSVSIWSVNPVSLEELSVHTRSALVGPRGVAARLDGAACTALSVPLLVSIPRRLAVPASDAIR